MKLSELGCRRASVEFRFELMGLYAVQNGYMIRKYVHIFHAQRLSEQICIDRNANSHDRGHGRADDVVMAPSRAVEGIQR